MRQILLLAILLLTAMSCREQQSFDGQLPSPKTEEDKIFYTLGLDVGRTFWSYRMSDRELQMFALGVYDVNMHKPVKVDSDVYRDKIYPLGQARAKVAAEEEKARSKEFMEKAAREPGAQQLPSGLIYKELSPGKGESPKPTDIVRVHYRGTIIDGTEFDNSYKRGQPNEFTLLAAMPCWVEAIQKMKPGGKSKIVCPSNLGYGDKGDSAMVVGGATLSFDLELLSFSDKPPTSKAELPLP